MTTENVAGSPVFSDNIRGALLMCASMAGFISNDTLMKYVTQDFPLYQAVAIRGVFVMPLLALYAGLFSDGLRLRIPRVDWGRLALRSVAEIGATMLYLIALMNMALADLQAIIQSLPLLLILAAAIWFGETIGPRRIGAIIVGFIGMIIILRPGTGAFDVWALIAFASVISIAVRDLVTRRFSRGMTSTTIAFYAALVIMLFGIAMAPTETWRMPSLSQILLLFGAAIAVTVGYISGIATMRVGEIGFVSPFRYTSLIWAIILGLLVFGDWPDGWTQLGAVLIVGAGLYSIWRERAAKAVP